MEPGRRNGKNQTDRAAVDAENDAPKPYEFHKLTRSKNVVTSVHGSEARGSSCWQDAQTRSKYVHAEIEGVSADVLRRGKEKELLDRESERTRAQKLRRELTEFVVEQRIVEKALGTVKRLKDKCPTCGQPISAGAKAREAEKQSGRLAEIEGLVHRIRVQLSKFTETRSRKVPSR